MISVIMFFSGTFRGGTNNTHTPFWLFMNGPLKKNKKKEAQLPQGKISGSATEAIKE